MPVTVADARHERVPSRSHDPRIERLDVPVEGSGERPNVLSGSLLDETAEVAPPCEPTLEQEWPQDCDKEYNK